MSTTTHDRLIFNRAGESVRAMDAGKGKVRIQCTALRPSMEHDYPGRQTEGGTTVEIVLEKRDAVGFIMQIATMLGVACEVTP